MTSTLHEGTFVGGLPHSRSLRGLLAPPAHRAAPRIEVENPTDAIAMLRAEDAFDVRDRLVGIPTETRVIAGAGDGFRTLHMFAETAHRMPRGRLITYPRRGHALGTAPELAADATAFLRAPAA